MTDLSPAAQAVLDALYMDELNGPQQLMARAHVAAALRAAADQVVPDEVEERKMFPWQQERLAQRLITRDHIFTIAAELEDANE